MLGTLNQIYVEVGRLLREARERSKLTQRELGQRVGLSRTSITNIERGFQQISVGTLYALGAALATDVIDLLPRNRAFQPSLSVIEKSKLPLRDKSTLRDVVSMLSALEDEKK